MQTIPDPLTPAQATTGQKQVFMVPAGQVIMRGWAPFDSKVTAVRLLMTTADTGSQSDFTLTNEGAAASVLVGASMDMTADMADGVVENLVLAASLAARTFVGGGEWTATFDSDGLAFSGSSVFFEIVFTATSG